MFYQQFNILVSWKDNAAIPSKNAVSAHIWIVVDTPIQHSIPGQSTTVVKGCMYIYFIW